MEQQGCWTPQDWLPPAMSSCRVWRSWGELDPFVSE